MPSRIVCEQRRYAVFCVKFFLVFLLAFLLQFPINYFMDPYDIYNEAAYQGLNKDKTRRPPRVSIPFRTMRLRENALVFGSSRVLPIDCWSYYAATPSIQWRNLWINMANIHEISRAVVQAVATQEIRLIVLGLDFFAFNSTNVSTGFFQDASYALNADESRNPWGFLGESCVALSPSTTRDSVITFADNLGLTPQINALLYRSSQKTTFPPSSKASVQVDSAAQDAHAAKRAEARALAAKVARDFSFVNHQTGVDTIADLKNLIESCVRHSTALYIFTTPEQALLLDSYAAVGAWPAYVEWLRTITTLIDSEKRNHPEADIRFRSFSGYTNATTVSPSSLNFEDLVHYRPQIGRKITDILFEKQSPPADDPYFGILLTPENIDAAIQAFEWKKDVAHRP